jgi:amidase
MKLRLFALLSLILIAAACVPTGSKYDQLGLEEITIPELREAYNNGDFSIEDVTEAYLQRIQDVDVNGPKLNSIITVNPDAIEIARQLDQELAEGKIRGPLHGVPVILKDNIDTGDKMPNTAGARPMEGSMPLRDAFIVERLRDSGAIILAKANLSEWANFHSSRSSSGWSALGGQTRNPYDITRNPCGSSAGSGASASANLAVFAIGTETNGSITCPSNANGLVGIKPTVGLLSRSGIIPISFTQDTPGPMARTVTDAAIALGAMTGVDKRDSKTADSEGNFHTDYTQFLNEDGLKGKKIGIYTSPLGRRFRLDSLFNQNIRHLESMGAEVVEIEDLITENIGGAGFQVLMYEFKDGLNAYFASLGENAKVRNVDDLAEKTFADSVSMQYFDHSLIRQAQEIGDLTDKAYTEAVEKMLKAYRENGIDKVMDEMGLDAIVGPTGSPAWKTDLTNGDNFGGVSSSTPAARAGYPHITVPMGYIDGLPVGISFFGRAWSEPILLEIAYAYEQSTKHRKAPEFRGWDRK